MCANVGLASYISQLTVIVTAAAYVLLVQGFRHMAQKMKAIYAHLRFRKLMMINIQMKNVIFTLQFFPFILQSVVVV